MVLVGNKTDLHMDRCVTTEEGKALAEEMKAVFLETSAKENRVRNYFCSSRHMQFYIEMQFYFEGPRFSMFSYRLSLFGLG